MRGERTSSEEREMHFAAGKGSRVEARPTLLRLQRASSGILWEGEGFSPSPGWSRHQGICHRSLTHWARASLHPLGEPGAVNTSSQSCSLEPPRASCWLLLEHVPMVQRVLMCVCACTHMWAGHGGGPGVGHPAAGEVQSMPLTQGDWPTVPAPRPAVLLPVRQRMGSS